MPGKLKIAVVQQTASDNFEKNIEHITQTLESTRKQRCQAVFFPENSVYLRTDFSAPAQAMTGKEKFFDDLAKWSKENDCLVNLGSVPLKAEEKCTNSSVWVTPESGVEFAYEKIHLFDIHLPGQKPILESETYRAGKKPVLRKWRGFSFGLSICYDLRFAELYSLYASQNVDVILVPSAFLHETGSAHWEVLLRARAIESQSYVVAAAQGGLHTSESGKKRRTYGHSMAIDPWGNVLVEAEDKPTVLYSEINMAELDRVRKQMPMNDHRRLL